MELVGGCLPIFFLEMYCIDVIDLVQIVKTFQDI